MIAHPMWITMLSTLHQICLKEKSALHTVGTSGKRKKVCDRISYPETSFESLADYIQCDWVDARVEGCHVDAKVVQDEKNTEKGGYMLDIH